MDTTQIAKQTLDFQKTIFSNSFTAMVTVQDQTEKMFNSYFEKFTWVNEENKKPFNASIEMAKKTREEFKKAVDEGYAKCEEMLVNK